MAKKLFNCLQRMSRGWLHSGRETPDSLMALNTASVLTHLVEPLEGRQLLSVSLIRDISPGNASSSPSLRLSVPGGVAVFGGSGYFTATDSANGLELWKSDGTSDGTVMVKDINAGPDSSDPAYLTHVGGALLFGARTATHNQELWRSDGSAEGTAMVRDINPGPDFSDPSFPILVGNNLLFAAAHAETGWELWTSDGTEDGTRL